MTTRSASLLILAAALFSPALVATSAAGENPAYGYYASKVMVPAWDDLLSRTVTFDITPGVSRYAVQARLGKPVAALSDDVWVYDSCRPNYSDAQDRGCNLLVITFDGQAVTEMKFVNAPMARSIAATMKGSRAATYALNK